MKVLLTYLRSKKHYSIWNPLSIESLIGHLQCVLKKVQVDGFDIIDENDEKKLLSVYQEYDVIGFSISSYTLDTYVDLLRKMKLSDKYVLLGNQLPTYLSEDILKLTLNTCDVKENRLFISLGEGEICLENLFGKICMGDRNYSDIENLVYFENGKIITNKIHPVDLTNLKYPPKYLDTKMGTEVMQMQLSRGCYWGNCSFCTRLSFRNGRRWQSFPMERIKQDLYNTIINQKVLAIEFCDDEFFGGRTKDRLERAREIGSYIHDLATQRGEKVQFRIFTRPDFIYSATDLRGNENVKNLLIDLKEYGLSRIYMGIESGCDSQLKRYNRGLSVEIAEKAIETLKEIEMNFDSGFILFDPELNLNEICENINFYKKNNLIETNQWFWRPMIANVGSKIGNAMLEKGNSYDINSMSVEYDFDDPVVAYIYKIVDDASAETRDIFYALKSISKKDYDYSDKSKYNYVAHDFVKRNGMIYVGLLENISAAIIKAREEVRELVNEVEVMCEEKQFDEKDSQELLDKIHMYKC